MATVSTERDGARPLQRRCESRIHAQLNVRVEDAQQATLQTHSRDFSLGGLCITSPRTYPAGHRLQLQIELGGDFLEIYGVVAWTQPREEALGVRFVDVPEEAEYRLEAVVWLLTGLSA
jgi:uncharacterized protein (TIGR02266 family)